MGFPKDFMWGAATASYQIEGAAKEDGRGASIWDVFSHTEGKIKSMENGDIACDHYHRMEEDVKIMKEMGLRAYRFSISWSRLFPLGDGMRNEKGFAFYDKLVDCLLENGIEPVMTLFHWDLPQALFEKGGFAWEGISDIFGRYAGAAADHFSDRVKMFLTINEPQCVTELGYVKGVYAPGYQWKEGQEGVVMKNLLLSHGKAVKALRQYAKQPVLIGTATTGALCYPLDDSEEAEEKAYALSFPTDGEGIGFSHNWFLDPAILGKHEIDLFSLNEKEMEIIRQPIDFIGINIYNGQQCDKNGYVKRYQGFPRTALGWAVTPEIMDYGLRFLQRRYGLPVYVTENGTACNDKIYGDGRVHDVDRIDFTGKYLKEMEKAIEKGCDIRGYFHWSLMDNFEWNEGYAPRFGLIFVDYRNQERIWKDSAYWYRKVIENNGINFDGK